MYYILLIFVIVFQTAVVWLAPGFGLAASGGINESVAVNSTSELIAAGTNPFATFGQIMTFQLDGAEAVSVVFIVLDLICLVIPLLSLIRGKN